MGREIAPLDLPEPEYDPERDLAYWLESTDPRDPNVLHVLYERYGRDVQQLVMWLLAEEMRLNMLKVQHVLRKIFGLALARLEGFRGQESVHTWIMGLALEAVRTEKRQCVLRKANWFFRRREAHQWVETRSGDYIL